MPEPAATRGTPLARSMYRQASPAAVAELVDAHGSGPCGGNPVEVQVLSAALTETVGPAPTQELLSDG